MEEVKTCGGSCQDRELPTEKCDIGGLVNVIESSSVFQVKIVWPFNLSV